MKYLIPLILLFPSLAFAVDDAVINEIDVKASSANTKADSNNSRIQALETEDILIKEKISLNETKVVERLSKKADTLVVDDKLSKKSDEVEVVRRLLEKADETKVVERLSKKAEIIAVDANKEVIELNRLKVLEVDVKASEANSKADGNSGRIGALETDIDALEAEDIVLGGKIDTVASDLAAIELITGPEGPAGLQGPAGADGTNGTNGTDGAQGPAGADGASLPVGAAPGDILYWDGSVWQLTPAPPVGAAKPPKLTLIAGVPTWAVYAIGDTGPAGGIVFYVAADGIHGLEAARGDQGTNAYWGCRGTDIAGADGTAVGDGAQNTADIVAGCDEATRAAHIADAYTANGYSDWFLPSRDELNLLFRQKDIVGGFSSGNYWSSSEYSANDAWTQHMFGGVQEYASKTFPLRVRAVRAF